MRKTICITMAVCLLSLFTGCTNTASTPNDSVVFYYIHNDLEYGTDSGVVTSTVVEEIEVGTDYYALLEKYFNGPTNYDCISPFPAGITLEELNVDNNKAQLLLSPHMATLSGASMTVALACLTRTVVELTGVSTVQIEIQNNQILGADSLTLSVNKFAYCDTVTLNDAS